MKIAILGKITGLSPCTAGGAQTLARNIARLCVIHGILVDFILWGKTNSFQREENYQIDEQSIKIYYFANERDALSLIASRDYTKVFIFMIPFREMLLLYKIKKCKKLIYFDLYFSNFHRRVIKKILASFLFSKVVTFSPRIAKSYFLIKNKLIYSLPVVSDKILKIALANREVGNEKFPKFAYVGGVFIEKGIERLIRVFKRINLMPDKNFNLTIFGYYNPSNAKDAEILQEINIQPFITEKFLDQELSCSKNYEDNLSQLYSETDVIILPYARKHINSVVDIPLVIMESLLSGCIVITPKIKHYEEVGVSKEFQYETEEELEKIILSINHQQIRRENESCEERKRKYLHIVNLFYTNLIKCKN